MYELRSGGEPRDGVGETKLRGGGATERYCGGNAEQARLRVPGLRRGLDDGPAITVERLGELVGDLVRVLTFDTVPLDHVNQLAVLEQGERR